MHKNLDISTWRGFASANPGGNGGYTAPFFN